MTRLSTEEVRRLRERPPGSISGLVVATLCDSYLDVCEELEAARAALDGVAALGLHPSCELGRSPCTSCAAILTARAALSQNQGETGG